MVRGVWGVAIEVGVGDGATAAVPTDDVEDGALGTDAGDEGVQPAGGCSFGCAIDGILQGEDTDDEDALAVDVELAVHDGDRLGQRVVVALGPHLYPIAMNGQDGEHRASDGAPSSRVDRLLNARTYLGHWE